MVEYQGNLWDFAGRPGYVICITTNCSRKRNGLAVMGAGCAFEAQKRHRDLPRLLAVHIEQSGGMVPVFLTNNIIAFPVKNQWWEKANMEFINSSAIWLKTTARNMPDRTFLLPRPGCGNGGLKWADVHPVIRNILPDNVVIVSP